MVNIVFQQPPLKGKYGRNWRIHLGHLDRGFKDFATKREACEFNARLGREATACMRELNEEYRRVTHEGQGLCCAMTAQQIVAWNELKASFDMCIAYLAIRNSVSVPHAMVKLISMARDVQQMGAMVRSMSKTRYTGSATAMASCTQAAAAIERRIAAAWSGNLPEEQADEDQEERRMLA